MNPLTITEVKAKLAEHIDWYLDEETQRIYTGFEFENFSQAMDFLNAIADIADSLDHHPDLYLYDYKYLQVFIKTQEGINFTDKDFELIDSIDELFKSLESEIQIEQTQTTPVI